jgi:hypothetical protein
MRNLIKTGLFALLLAFASCQNSSPAPQADGCDCERSATTLSASLLGKAKTDPTTGKLSLRLPTENGVWRELCNPAFALEAIRLLLMPQDSLFKLTGKLSPVCKENEAADGKTSKQFYKVEIAELRPPMDNTYQSPCKCDVTKLKSSTVTAKLQFNEWGELGLVAININEIIGSNQHILVQQKICNNQAAFNLIKQQVVKPDSLFQFEAKASDLCGTPNDGPTTVPAFYRFYEVINIKN